MGFSEPDGHCCYTVACCGDSRCTLQKYAGSPLRRIKSLIIGPFKRPRVALEIRRVCPKLTAIVFIIIVASIIRGTLFKFGSQ